MPYTMTQVASIRAAVREVSHRRLKRQYWSDWTFKRQFIVLLVTFFQIGGQWLCLIFMSCLPPNSRRLFAGADPLTDGTAIDNRCHEGI